MQREGTDLANIRSHIVAFRAIASSSAAYQLIVFVDQRNTSTVEFGFDAVVDRVESGQFPGFTIEIKQIICIV